MPFTAARSLNTRCQRRYVAVAIPFPVGGFFLIETKRSTFPATARAHKNHAMRSLFVDASSEQHVTSGTQLIPVIDNVSCDFHVYFSRAAVSKYRIELSNVGSPENGASGSAAFPKKRASVNEYDGFAPLPKSQWTPLTGLFAALRAIR